MAIKYNKTAPCNAKYLTSGRPIITTTTRLELEAMVSKDNLPFHLANIILFFANKTTPLESHKIINI